MKGPGDSEKIKKIEAFCGIKIIEKEYLMGQFVVVWEVWMRGIKCE